MHPHPGGHHHHQLLIPGGDIGGDTGPSMSSPVDTNLPLPIRPATIVTVNTHSRYPHKLAAWISPQTLIFHANWEGRG